jgi:hypothetical protein
MNTENNINNEDSNMLLKLLLFTIISTILVIGSGYLGFLLFKITN